jgi:hypothetical protein
MAIGATMSVCQVLLVDWLPGRGASVTAANKCVPSNPSAPSSTTLASSLTRPGFEQSSTLSARRRRHSSRAARDCASGHWMDVHARRSCMRERCAACCEYTCLSCSTCVKLLLMPDVLPCSGSSSTAANAGAKLALRSSPSGTRRQHELELALASLSSLWHRPGLHLYHHTSTHLYHVEPRASHPQPSSSGLSVCEHSTWHGPGRRGRAAVLRAAVAGAANRKARL